MPTQSKDIMVDKTVLAIGIRSKGKKRIIIIIIKYNNDFISCYRLSVFPLKSSPI